MKRRQLLSVVVALSVLFAAASASGSDLPLEQMKAAIDKGTDFLIGQQQADGSWPYDIDWVKGTTYDCGMTALCTLALAHTRLPRATGTVHKGLAYIVQRKPEPATYSVGLIEMLLFEQGASRYRKHIDRYAWMDVMSIKRDGVQKGSWGYRLVDYVPPPAQGRLKIPDAPDGRSDNSNSQFGVLGMWYAQRAGFQISPKFWQVVKAYYESAQNKDGGWGYTSTAYNKTINRPPQGSYLTMTAASTISLYLADESLSMLQPRHQCKMVPENPAVEAGLKWIGDRGPRSNEPYTLYTIERLGIMTGYSEFGGVDWMEEGAKRLSTGNWPDGRDGKRSSTAFAVLFLARALEPIIFYKLKRKGDWNNDRYDVKHLAEYISVKFQYPKQWRIVTLEAPVSHLLKVPAIYMNGHEALDFTAEEKAKLKEYIEKGGTIYGMACCGKKPFDDSFRALVAELWPENSLQKLPKNHTIFTNPRPLQSKPALEAMALKNGQGRLGVIYSPTDLCCNWHKGGERAKSHFDVGANIYFYISKVGVKLGGIPEGYHVKNTAKPETRD